MKKFTKILSLLIFGLFMTLSLASCGNDFYNDYAQHGVEGLDKDEIYFETVEVSDVVARREAKESFMLFIGDSTNQNCQRQVVEINNVGKNLSYDGVFLYLSVTDIVKSIPETKNACKSLGCQEVQVDTGLIAVLYVDGDISFDTSNDEYETVLKIFNSTGNLSFDAIAVYTINNYPTAKAE